MSTNDVLAKGQSRAMESVKQRVAVTPAVDVHENQEELLLLIDVPGATKEGMTVHLEKGELSIEAQRARGDLGAPISRETGDFDVYVRTFSLPSGLDTSKIDANLSAGVLRIRLPKADGAKPRKIEIRAN